MTEVSLISLWRCGISACLAVILGYSLLKLLLRHEAIQSSGGKLQWLIHLCLILLFVQPTLATGYYYGHFLPVLSRHDWLNKLIYLMLLSARLLPWAYLAFRLMPPVIQDDSVYLLRMLKPRKGISWSYLISRLRLWIAGQGRSFLGAFMLTMMVGYQEFELASLMSLEPRSWTERLFLWQRFSPPYLEMMQQLILPLGIQFLMIGLLAWLLKGRLIEGALQRLSGSSPLLPTGRSWPCWCLS